MPPPPNMVYIHTENQEQMSSALCSTRGFCPPRARPLGHLPYGLTGELPQSRAAACQPPCQGMLTARLTDSPQSCLRGLGTIPVQVRLLQTLSLELQPLEDLF